MKKFIAFYFVLLTTACSTHSISESDATDYERCVGLSMKGTDALSNGNYQQSINIHQQVLSTCQSDDIDLAREVASSYASIGISYYALGQYQNAITALDAYLSSPNLIAPLNVARFYKSLSQARIEPENANKYLNEASRQLGYLNIDLLNAQYDLGERDAALLQRYLSLANSSPNKAPPLRKSADFDRPIELAKALGDKPASEMLNHRQAAVSKAEMQAISQNIPGISAEFGGDDESGLMRSTFFANAYAKADEPLLADYYQGRMKYYQSLIKSKAISEQKSVEQERRNEEIRQQNREQDYQSLATINDAVTATSGKTGINALGAGVASMSGTPELATLIDAVNKTTPSSVVNSEHSNSRDCNEQTPDGFKRCCSIVRKGVLKQTANSDGTITYGCITQSNWVACSYSGNVVKQCVVQD